MTILRTPRRVLIASIGVVSALMTFMPADAATTATVTGQIVDTAGKPISGLRVYASEQVSDPGVTYFDQVGSTTTGTDGRYRIAVKAEGTSIAVCAPGDSRFVGRCFGEAQGRGDGSPYAPYLTSDGYLDPEYKGTRVTVAGGKTKSGINFTLSPPARVRGYVKAADGKAVAGRSVTVRSSTRCDDTCREVIATGSTDKQGRYDIAITQPTDSPDLYCLVVEGAPVRHGSIDGRSFDCTKSIRTGQIVDEADTTIGSATITKVNTPYWVGSAKVGWTLSARPGTWNPGNVNLAFAWFDGTRKLGTGATYTVQPAELGHQITLRTTASASGYKPAVVDFTRAETTAKGDIYTGRAPTISGTAKVGRTLKVSASTPAPSATITYQWLRHGSAVSGATKSSYKVPKSDKGKTISVAVTYTKTGYNTLVRMSTPTSDVK